MPRASAGKRHQGVTPNQHNTRHENGLVGPGKRVQKQKSNGHISAGAKQQLSEHTPSTPSPGTTTTPSPANGHVRPAVDHGSESSKSANGIARRGSAGVDSEGSESESSQNVMISQMSQEQHRRIDVNEAKNPAVHYDLGPLRLVITVLRSCPLYDTIAILIVLLQLPPAFLSIVHLLFATLTFVPPTISANSTFSFTDVFEGTLGTPSLHTIILADLVCLGIWLFLWGPLQDIVLDFAQSVIALTLGGGTTGREAGTRNGIVCFGLVGASHLARSGRIKQSGLRMLLSSSRGSLGSDPDDPLEVTYSSARKSPHGWIRSIIAVHILAQGIVRYVRNLYVRGGSLELASSNFGDPEAGKGSITQADTLSHDASATIALQSGAESMSMVSAISFDKTLSAKKKRRQSAQVRTRQPLWAALASTKIVMVKEYETSHAALESAGTNATDVNNLGNAPFDSEPNRIWITDVGIDEVRFNTSYFPDLASEADEDEDSGIAPGVDITKPFFVRVNGTVWQPTRIHASESSSLRDARWSGEIFGLAPMSNYECEFVCTIDCTVLFATNVRTLPAPIDDIASSVNLSPDMQRSLRRGSPTSILKASIATAETKLLEERNKQKRDRKDQKSKTNATRREIEKLSSSIASSGSGDDRLRQKTQQSNLHKKQAEDAVVAITEELEALQALPEDESDEWKTARKAWQSQKDVHEVARSNFSSSKQSLEREVQTINSDISSLLQKHERMQTRVAKLNGEHERITDANARGLNEAQRRSTERTAKAAERARLEKQFTERLESMEPLVQERENVLMALYSNINTLQFSAAQAQVQAQAQAQLQAQAQFQVAQAAQAQQSPTMSIQAATTTAAAAANNNNPAYDIPEGVVPPMSAYPWNLASSATGAPYASVVPQGAVIGNNNNNAFGPPPPGGALPTLLASTSQQSHHRTRGRSSSMLSNVSGFTQSSGEDVPSGVVGGGCASGPATANKHASSLPGGQQGHGFVQPSVIPHQQLQQQQPPSSTSSSSAYAAMLKSRTAQPPGFFPPQVAVGTPVGAAGAGRSHHRQRQQSDGSNSTGTSGSDPRSPVAAAAAATAAAASGSGIGVPKRWSSSWND